MRSQKETLQENLTEETMKGSDFDNDMKGKGLIQCNAPEYS